jgi:hypothetical protein
MCDCEIDKLCNEFDDELSILLEKWAGKIPSYSIVYSLMRELKLTSCFDNECYYHMLGDLTDTLTIDLNLMFEDIQKVKKELEKKEEK